MTTTPETPEQIVAEAMMIATDNGADRAEEYAAYAVHALRAAGLLVGDPTEEQIDRALTAYENHAGCRGDEFREYVCPECGHLYATVEDRRAGLEGIDLYEAGHRHRMTEALAAAGVAPQEPSRGVSVPGYGGTSTGPTLMDAPSPDREKLIEEAKYLSENSWQTWWPDRAQRALAACADALAAQPVLDPEKVAEVVATTLGRERPWLGARRIARALCEAAKRGELT